MVFNLGSADPLGVITVNGGGPRSPKIGHRGSAGEKRLRTTVLSCYVLGEGPLIVGIVGPQSKSLKTLTIIK